MRKFKNKESRNIAITIDHGETYMGTQYYQVEADKKSSIPYYLIENNSNWEEIIEYSIGTKVCYNKSACNWIYEKISEKTWKVLGSTIYCQIENKAIGERKRFKIVEEKKPFLITEDKYERYIGDKVYVVLKGFQNKDEWHLLSDDSIAITNYWTRPQSNYRDFYDLEAAKQWIKKNNPLFITEDGKEIYDGDIYFCPNTDDDWLIYNYKAMQNVNNIYKAFSTEEAANQYIIDNKPEYSLKEITDWFGTNRIQEFKNYIEKIRKN